MKSPPAEPGPTADTPLRHAARVLVIDRDDRVLLFRFVDPATGAAFWITPGGGLDDGEAYEDAARRELREETGINADGQLGPCVWTRTIDIRYGHKVFRQHERYFTLRVEDVAVDTTGMLDYEVEDLTEHRWWSAHQIAAHHERFAPSRLGVLLAELVAGKAAATPIDVGK
ncbi:MAG: NUDIX domain-containing protein [Planctomycetota bacterium]